MKFRLGLSFLLVLALAAYFGFTHNVPVPEDSVGVVDSGKQGGQAQDAAASSLHSEDEPDAEASESSIKPSRTAPASEEDRLIAIRVLGDKIRSGSLSDLDVLQIIASDAPETIKIGYLQGWNRLKKSIDPNRKDQWFAALYSLSIETSSPDLRANIAKIFGALNKDGGFDADLLDLYETTGDDYLLPYLPKSKADQGSTRELQEGLQRSSLAVGRLNEGLASIAEDQQPVEVKKLLVHSQPTHWASMLDEIAVASLDQREQLLGSGYYGIASSSSQEKLEFLFSRWKSHYLHDIEAVSRPVNFAHEVAQAYWTVSNETRARERSGILSAIGFFKATDPVSRHSYGRLSLGCSLLELCRESEWHSTCLSDPITGEIVSRLRKIKSGPNAKFLAGIPDFLWTAFSQSAPTNR